MKDTMKKIGLKVHSKEYLNLEKSTKIFADSIDLMFEHNRLDSMVRKNKYDELIKQGFTAKQALELVK